MLRRIEFIVLRELSKRPKSGYSIVKDVFERTGWKLSYGAIYPVLKSFLDQKLVTLSISGRKKIYSLTKEGRLVLKKFDSEREQIAARLRKDLFLIGDIMDSNPEGREVIELFISSLKTGENPFAAIENSISMLRRELLSHYKKGTLKELSRDIKRVINNAAKEIKSLKGRNNEKIRKRSDNRA